MTEDHQDPKDAVRHRNLERIGQAYSPLPRADDDRQARWQQTPANEDINTNSKGVSFMKRHKNFAFITSGSLAAAVALAVWFGPGSTGAVSANTILENLKAALGRKLTIDIEGVDLGDVEVSGQIILDRQGGWLNEATDTLYSELHVVLNASNPEWNDLDAAVVVCQSPDNAWTYCRGNGGSTSFLNPKRVVESDYLDKDRSWRQFMENPLGAFDGMPFNASFSSGNSHVEYRFPIHQRTYVQQLLYFLLFDLGNAESVDHVIANLRSTAGSLDVELAADSMWVLHVADVAKVGILNSQESVEIPDLDALADEIVTTFTYYEDSGQIRSTSSRTPEKMQQLGILIASHDVPMSGIESLEALTGRLKSAGEVISVTEKSDAIWEIEVKGPPVTLDTSAIDWRNHVLPELLKKLELRVYYDSKTETVRRAEFHGIGLKNGQIVLEMGKADLDPTLLKWDGWVKDCLIPAEQRDQVSFAQLCNCTEVYDETND